MDLIVLGFLGAAFVFFWVVYLLYFWLPMAKQANREYYAERERERRAGEGARPNPPSGSESAGSG